eukprot:4378924-Pleurochrysis_carterae.AAC.6
MRPTYRVCAKWKAPPHRDACEEHEQEEARAVDDRLVDHLVELAHLPSEHAHLTYTAQANGRHQSVEGKADTGSVTRKRASMSMDAMRS